MTSFLNYRRHPKGETPIGASSVDLAEAAGCTKQPRRLSKGKVEGLEKKGVTWRRAPSREEAPHFVALGVGQGGLAGLPHARKRERERG